MKELFSSYPDYVLTHGALIAGCSGRVDAILISEGDISWCFVFLVEAVTLWLQIFVRFLLDPLGVRGSSVAILTQVLPSCSHTALRRRTRQSLCIRHRGHRWDRAGGKGWLDLMRYADMHMICTWYAHDAKNATWCYLYSSRWPTNPTIWNSMKYMICSVSSDKLSMLKDCLLPGFWCSLSFTLWLQLQKSNYV